MDMKLAENFNGWAKAAGPLGAAQVEAGLASKELSGQMWQACWEWSWGPRPQGYQSAQSLVRLAFGGLSPALEPEANLMLMKICASAQFEIGTQKAAPDGMRKAAGGFARVPPGQWEFLAREICEDKDRRLWRFARLTMCACPDAAKAVFAQKGSRALLEMDDFGDGARVALLAAEHCPEKLKYCLDDRNWDSGGFKTWPELFSACAPGLRRDFGEGMEEASAAFKGALARHLLRQAGEFFSRDKKQEASGWTKALLELCKGQKGAREFLSAKGPGGDTAYKIALRLAGSYAYHAEAFVPFAQAFAGLWEFGPEQARARDARRFAGFASMAAVDKSEPELERCVLGFCARALEGMGLQEWFGCEAQPGKTAAEQIGAKARRIRPKWLRDFFEARLEAEKLSASIASGQEALSCALFSKALTGEKLVMFSNLLEMLGDGKEKEFDKIIEALKADPRIAPKLAKGQAPASAGKRRGI